MKALRSMAKNDTPTARNEKVASSNRRDSVIDSGSRELSSDEREMMTLAATCVFFGGADRPIHYSTLYTAAYRA